MGLTQAEIICHVKAYECPLFGMAFFLIIINYYRFFRTCDAFQKSQLLVINSCSK